jgi:glycosyltransferase involved in cell wall biosynthesis
MNGLPLASILILNHNRGRALRASIASALAQTYPRVEIVVVDDGSTDDSANVIRDLGRRVVPVLQRHRGEAAAINTGFHHCNGEIVCLLQSGDTFHPSKVNEVVEAGRLSPRSGLIYHRVQTLDALGQTAQPAWPEKLMSGDFQQMLVASGGWWPFAPCSGLSFRRPFLERLLEIPMEEFESGAAFYLTDLAPFLAPVCALGRTLSCVQDPEFSRREGESEAQCRDRLLSFYEVRTRVLNESLRIRNLPYQVSLHDNWPYQWLRFQQGTGNPLWELSAMALRFPGEPDLHARVRNLAQLLLGTNIVSPTNKLREYWSSVRRGQA